MASKSRLRMNGCRARTKAGMLDGTHVARLKSSASAPLADGMCVRLRWGLSNLGLSVGNFNFSSCFEPTRVKRFTILYCQTLLNELRKGPKDETCSKREALILF